ncbi:hypothetical protein Bca4012_057847 [Brassica carinata]
MVRNTNRHENPWSRFIGVARSITRSLLSLLRRWITPVKRRQGQRQTHNHGLLQILLSRTDVPSISRFWLFLIDSTTAAVGMSKMGLDRGIGPFRPVAGRVWAYELVSRRVAGLASFSPSVLHQSSYFSNRFTAGDCNLSRSTNGASLHASCRLLLVTDVSSLRDIHLGDGVMVKKDVFWW